MTDTAAAGATFDTSRAYTVLICDLIGLRYGSDGTPDHSELRDYIRGKGGLFHDGRPADEAGLEQGRIHFFYQPDLSTARDLMDAAGEGQYDAVIAAATFLPASLRFASGGVRIGAGTGNMGSASWGGGSGEGGEAPLMNTPGINSRATAQMVMKAILKVLPDLDVATLDRRVAAADFDTGRDLRNYPTSKLEGKTIGIIGYGNIGREVAKLARAFGMHVRVHARAPHRPWIEAEGFIHAETLEDAARDADVLSVHVGLGSLDAGTGRYANANLIDHSVLSKMRHGGVLINYDRGELVDIAALDEALTSGILGHASIDADLFTDAATGAVSGPMKPYLSLLGRHRDKLELLPHAAADTDHPSRVAGAKQAVDQIMDAIIFRRVTNLKGSLPAGYIAAGVRTPSGVGPVTSGHLLALAAQTEVLSTLAGMAAVQAERWRALANAQSDAERQALVASGGEELVKAITLYATAMENLSLRGPYRP